jgi:hypothetical protein
LEDRSSASFCGPSFFFNLFFIYCFIAFLLDKFGLRWYNQATQKNKHGSSEYASIRCRAHCMTVLLGDKEIAVKIRSNSHYRNSACSASGQVGMLIAP